MTEQRVAKLEAQMDALTRAVHLLTVAHKPTSEWLDSKMEQIDAEFQVLASEHESGTQATETAQRPGRT